MNPASDPLVGNEISHYRVLRKLGGGGMGVVYEAEDLKLGRRVALKFLNESLSDDPQAIERFRREARIASALNHPNICTIFEINDSENRVFIAMELLEGQTLRSVISDQPLPIKRLLDLALDICDGLEAAHTAGLLHRDLKPANIFVTERRGSAKILDFGLAKLTDISGLPLDTDQTVSRSHRALTSDGATVGTVNYMSPEQVRGEPLECTSDLFSFGAVLYEMVTGRQCFPGKTMGLVFDSVLNRKPTSIRALNPEVPRKLEQAIERLLEKNPQSRYPSAEALTAELHSMRQEMESSRSVRPASSAIRLRPRQTISVAVLPFRNTTGDATSDYLSDGISESIIDILTRLPKLRVIARHTAFRYKGNDADPMTVGRELAVSAVLTGRVSQFADRLVIRAELVDVTNGWQLWGEQYTRSLTDIFEIQEQIADEISSKLKLKLSPDEKKRIRKRPTDDASAYKLYLKGRYALHKRYEEQVKSAIVHFQEAIQSDPSYARAYAGMADCYSSLSFLFSMRPKDGMVKARAAAVKALEIDPQLAEAHTSRALVTFRYEWNLPEAESEFRKAIELSPGYANAHQWLGECLAAMERSEEAIIELQKALDLDPLSPITHAVLAGMYFFARQYDLAIETAEKSLELESNFWVARMFGGLSHAQNQQYDRALDMLLAGSRPLNLPLMAAAGYVQGESGHAKEVKKMFADLQQISRQRYVAPIFPAFLAAGMKDDARTLELLDKAVHERSGWMVFLRVDPRFDRLRPEPQFQEILRRTGLLASGRTGDSSSSAAARPAI